MPRPQVTATLKVPINELDDMRRTLEWFRELLPDTAKRELAIEHERGNLRDETTLVDGRKNPNVETVKPFGKIQYVGGLGPIEQAIHVADAVAHSRAPHRTGFLARSLQWFANGRPVDGPPSAREIGAMGNAELVDLAPYSTMAEIFVPGGVIFGTFNQVARQFGSTLSVGFRYKLAEDYGGHTHPPGRRFSHPFNVPVLSIGNPVSNVRPGVAKSRPGHNIRTNRKTARRALAGYLKGDL